MVVWCWLNLAAISKAAEEGDEDGVVPGVFQLEPVHSQMKTTPVSHLDKLAGAGMQSGRECS